MSIDRASWRWNSSSNFFSSFMTNSKNILKRVGDKRQPCLRPIFTEKHWVRCPSITAAHSVSLYIDFIIRTIWGLRLSLSSFSTEFSSIPCQKLLWSRRSWNAKGKGALGLFNDLSDDKYGVYCAPAWSKAEIALSCGCLCLWFHSFQQNSTKNLSRYWQKRYRSVVSWVEFVAL